ncbi:hypothetical protein H8K33_14070 [Undibacterium amnicola]|uniref:DUF349 domain-containing protein n=1 Tax=Undibacterium amnicola TaxID=1834038 RepID=A0ABR6XT00_9BURK|nr:contractile injection system tape measure protein [Undibacterium amnicola]MBC3832631.1 hypothetical protein [Undibacterium amnicola]
MRSANRIHDLVFDLSFTDIQADASAWADWIKATLLPVIDEVIEQQCRELNIQGHQIHRLESIELDLGTVLQAESERELSRRLHEQLSNSLRLQLAKVAGQSQQQEQAENAHTEFLHFLKTGQLKWERLSEAKYAHKRLLQEIVKSKTAPLPLQDITRDSRQLGRLLKQFDASDLFQITRMALKAWSREEQDLMLDWLGLEFLNLQTKHSEQAAIEKLWRFILPSIQNRINAFSEIAQAWMESQGASIATLKPEYQQLIETHTAISAQTRHALMQVIEQLSAKLNSTQILPSIAPTFDIAAPASLIADHAYARSRNDEIQNEEIRNLSQQFRDEIAEARIPFHSNANAEFDATSKTNFEFSAFHQSAFEQGDYAALASEWSALMLFCGPEIRQLQASCWQAWLEKFPVQMKLDLITLLHPDTAWYVNRYISSADPSSAPSSDPSSDSTSAIRLFSLDKATLDVVIVTALSSQTGTLNAAGIQEIIHLLHKAQSTGTAEGLVTAHHNKQINQSNQDHELIDTDALLTQALRSEDDVLLSNAVNLAIDEQFSQFNQLRAQYWRHWWQHLTSTSQEHILSRLHPQLASSIPAMKRLLQKQLSASAKSAQSGLLTTSDAATIEVEKPLFAYLWSFAPGQLSVSHFQQFFVKFGSQNQLHHIDKKNDAALHVTQDSGIIEQLEHLANCGEVQQVDALWRQLSTQHTTQVRALFPKLKRAQQMLIFAKLDQEQALALAQILQAPLAKLLAEYFHNTAAVRIALVASATTTAATTITETDIQIQEHLRQLLQDIILTDTQISPAKFWRMINLAHTLPQQTQADLVLAAHASTANTIIENLPYFKALQQFVSIPHSNVAAAEITTAAAIAPTASTAFSARTETQNQQRPHSHLGARSHPEARPHPLLASFRAWQDGRLRLADLGLQQHELYQYLHWWILHQDQQAASDYSFMLDSLRTASQASAAPEDLLVCALEALRHGESIDVEVLQKQALQLQLERSLAESFTPSEAELRKSLADFYSADQDNVTAVNAAISTSPDKQADRMHSEIEEQEFVTAFYAALNNTQAMQDFRRQVMQSGIWQEQLPSWIPTPQLHTFLIHYLDSIHYASQTEKASFLDKLERHAFQVQGLNEYFADAIYSLFSREHQELGALAQTCIERANVATRNQENTPTAIIKPVVETKLASNLPPDLARKLSAAALHRWIHQSLQQWIQDRIKRGIDNSLTLNTVPADAISRTQHEHLHSQFFAQLENRQAEQMATLLIALQTNLPEDKLQELKHICANQFELQASDWITLASWAQNDKHFTQTMQQWQLALANIDWTAQTELRNTSATSSPSSAKVLFSDSGIDADSEDANDLGLDLSENFVDVDAAPKTPSEAGLRTGNSSKSTAELHNERHTAVTPSLSTYRQQILPAQLAEAMLQANLGGLSSIWPQLVTHHQDILVQAQQRYLARRELRQLCIAKNSIPVLHDLLASLAPELSQLLPEIWQQWERFDTTLKQQNTLAEFQRHSFRIAYNAVFEQSLQQKNPLTQVTVLVQGIYSVHDANTLNDIFSSLCYQLDPHQAPNWHRILTKLLALNQFTAYAKQSIENPASIRKSSVATTSLLMPAQVRSRLFSMLITDSEIAASLVSIQDLPQLKHSNHDHPDASSQTLDWSLLTATEKKALLQTCLQQLTKKQQSGFWDALENQSPLNALALNAATKLETSLATELTTKRTIESINSVQAPRPDSDPNRDIALAEAIKLFEAITSSGTNFVRGDIDLVVPTRQEQALSLAEQETLCTIMLRSQTSFSTAERTFFQHSLHQLLSASNYAFTTIPHVLQEARGIARLCELATTIQLEALFKRLHTTIHAQLPGLLYRLGKALLINPRSSPSSPSKHHLVGLHHACWHAIYAASASIKPPIHVLQFTTYLLEQLLGQALDQLKPKLEHNNRAENVRQCLDKLAHFDQQLSLQLTHKNSPEAMPTVNQQEQVNEKILQRKENQDNAENATSNKYDSHLHNAGLVIVAPYLQRLFALLELTKDGAFIDKQAAERAVHLTQYIVTGEENTPEFSLALNKLLCGIPAVVPIPSGIQMTEHEKDVIQQMLTGIIAHWSAIGKTSIQGLRETFLAREGYLKFADDCWHLKIPQATFDMLLDRLPWSFAMIKFPWMPDPLHVNWR